jgi:hypothetical protein
VTSFSLRQPRFVPRSVNVAFVIDKVALGQVLLTLLWFSPVNISPLLLHIHLCVIWEMDKGPVSGHSSIET